MHGRRRTGKFLGAQRKAQGTTGEAQAKIPGRGGAAPPRPSDWSWQISNCRQTAHEPALAVFDALKATAQTVETGGLERSAAPSGVRPPAGSGVARSVRNRRMLTVRQHAAFQLCREYACWSVDCLGAATVWGPITQTAVFGVRDFVVEFSGEVQISAHGEVSLSAVGRDIRPNEKGTTERYRSGAPSASDSASHGGPI